MGIGEWWQRMTASARWDGTTGPPRSSNGASSFHLFWAVPPSPPGWVAAEATFEVVEPPTVAKLYFWALQVSFGDRGGGAHLGLQWFPIHPGSTAVNWGGYRAEGGELDGSTSALPSRPGNVNTRDYVWQPRRKYRLRVSPGSGPAPAGTTAWRGEITDLVTGVTTVVRELWAAGDRITGPMVWSEVFADCDDPSVVVRWSDLALTDADGRRVTIAGATTNYQIAAEGGCAATDIAVEGGAFVQRTSVVRVTRSGVRLELH